LRRVRELGAGDGAARGQEPDTRQRQFWFSPGHAVTLRCAWTKENINTLRRSSPAPIISHSAPIPAPRFPFFFARKSKKHFPIHQIT
jgi:hypothetical protein